MKNPEQAEDSGVDPLRQHILWLLRGGHAHRGIDDAFEDVPEEVRGTRPEHLEHSLWELLEHIRIAQWDILEFSRSASHESPPWPEGYWPTSPAPPSTEAWEESLGRLKGQLQELADLVENPSADLFRAFPWGDGQTLLREALLVADHTAYHLGQVIDVRRILGIWPPREG